jgi:murein L,D-transpeptidase YafK
MENKSKWIIIGLLLLFLPNMALAEDVSKSKQLTYPRVREAYNQKEKTLKKELEQQQYSWGEFELLVVGYKYEKELEIHLRKKGSVDKFQLFRTYAFCTLSGNLGPKRIQGDLQVPEGFYFIDRFNPSSQFHLSLGLNYPNASDKILSDPQKPGGDIFIHGDCVSIGCIPITDELIKELYVLCVEAREAGQKQIPVYLFPFRMTEEKFNTGVSLYPNHQAFWSNLKEGYALWLATQKMLHYQVDKKGAYVFKK